MTRSLPGGATRRRLLGVAGLGALGGLGLLPKQGHAETIDLGGDKGVKRVDLSLDGGATYAPASPGADEGKYSFRQWQAPFSLAPPGGHVLKVRCINSEDEAQPETPVWNASGYMSNTIESKDISAV